MPFTCRNGRIEGLKVITPFYAEDERGYFLKSIEKEFYAKSGIALDIFEEFETYSKQNVIRGLHFQTDSPQGKLVNVVQGSIMDVAVELRKGSPAFGQWESVLLTDANRELFWIPAGFAHGFEVLSEHALVSYRCVGKFLAECDTGIRWDDTDLGIQWQTETPILSVKDAGLMSLREFVHDYGALGLGGSAGGEI